MPTHPIILDLMTRTILGEAYRSLNSSLRHMVLPSGIYEASAVEYLFFHPLVSSILTVVPLSLASLPIQVAAALHNNTRGLPSQTQTHGNT
jgi:hypothetical protein